MFLFFLSQPLSQKTRNGGIAIETFWSEQIGTSKLTLGMLQSSDEGNYSCTSNGAISEVAEVRIVSAGIEGEKILAIWFSV